MGSNLTRSVGGYLSNSGHPLPVGSGGRTRSRNQPACPILRKEVRHALASRKREEHGLDSLRTQRNRLDGRDGHGRHSA